MKRLVLLLIFLVGCSYNGVYKGPYDDHEPYKGRHSHPHWHKFKNTDNPGYGHTHEHRHFYDSFHDWADHGRRED